MSTLTTETILATTDTEETTWLITAIPTARREIPLEAVASPLDNDTYYWAIRESVEYSVVRQTCERTGGKLASILTQDEHDFIKGNYLYKCIN